MTRPIVLPGRLRETLADTRADCAGSRHQLARLAEASRPGVQRGQLLAKAGQLRKVEEAIGDVLADQPAREPG